MNTFEENILIHAPRIRVWQALADIGAIHEWNPGVLDSRQTSDGDVALKATRHCELAGRRFLDEEVVEWTPEAALTMRITQSNVPIATADIRFTLEDDKWGTSVSVSPTYTLRFGMLGKLMDTAFVRRTYRKGMRDLLRGLKRHVEASPEAFGADS